MQLANNRLAWWHWFLLVVWGAFGIQHLLERETLAATAAFLVALVILLPVPTRHMTAQRRIPLFFLGSAPLLFYILVLRGVLG